MRITQPAHPNHTAPHGGHSLHAGAASAAHPGELPPHHPPRATTDARPAAPTARMTTPRIRRPAARIETR